MACILVCWCNDTWKHALKAHTVSLSYRMCYTETQVQMAAVCTDCTNHEEGEIFRASNLFQLSFQIARVYWSRFLLKSNSWFGIRGWFLHTFNCLCNSHHKVDKVNMVKTLFFFLLLIVGASINQLHKNKNNKQK